ncbi:MAG: branched-chain amino acid transport system ATP-binding protein, partial [Pseudothermotoga sp.]|nr:branched-chain amino acid transport system ATP-binding protein [Pseudothermotoga sp.]
MAILKLDKVTKKFGGLVAVNNVSLELEQGQLAGLIGPNGAGKTTIFNVITGVYRPEDRK